MRRLALIAALWAVPGFAQDGPSFVVAPADLLEYGVICDVDIEGQQPAPDTESGSLNIIGEAEGVDVVTRLVPAELGLTFGVRLGMEEGAVPLAGRVVVEHPPLDPSGVTRESWSAELLPGGALVSLYSFEAAHELVTGRWIFRFEAGGEVLSEQHFDVVDAAAVPAVMDACFDGVPIS